MTTLVTLTQFVTSWLHGRIVAAPAAAAALLVVVVVVLVFLFFSANFPLPTAGVKSFFLAAIIALALLPTRAPKLYKKYLEGMQQ